MLSDDLIYLRKLEATDLERTWAWINDPGCIPEDRISGAGIPVGSVEVVRTRRPLRREDYSRHLSQGKRRAP